MIRATRLCRKKLHRMTGRNVVMHNGYPVCHECDKARKLRCAHRRRGVPEDGSVSWGAIAGRFPALPATPAPSGHRVIQRKTIQGSEPRRGDLGTLKKKYGEGPDLAEPEE